MVNRKYVLLIIIAWIIFLLAFIGSKQFTFYTGTDITLKTVPVDPRDLFRGDYVILSYTINTISLDSILTNEVSFAKDDEVYLKLDVNSKYAKPIEISKKIFENELNIKGKVTKSEGNKIGVKYGIETYFVRQGKGKEIEREIGKIDVIVTIDKYGNALIKSLQIDDMHLE